MGVTKKPSTSDKSPLHNSDAPPIEPPTQETKPAPHPPSIRSLYTGFVHIIVGSAPKQDFGIHKGLICHYSKYFQAAFNSSFQEGLRGMVELPEEDPATFDIVYAWLYSQKLTQVCEGEDVTCNLTQISQVFVLAEKYEMSALCNAALDEIIRHYEVSNKVTPNLTYIYENTARGSSLRRVVLATYTAQPKHLSEVLQTQEIEAVFLACPEFLLDMSKLLSTSLSAIAPVKSMPEGKARHVADPCQYHHHAEGEARCS